MRFSQKGNANPICVTFKGLNLVKRHANEISVLLAAKTGVAIVDRLPIIRSGIRYKAG